MTRVRPPVPMRTCSLERHSVIDNSSSGSPYYPQDSQYSNFDDLETPTNENINLLNLDCANMTNNNMVNNTPSNMRQFEVPPPSYDQIT